MCIAGESLLPIDLTFFSLPAGMRRQGMGIQQKQNLLYFYSAGAILMFLFIILEVWFFSEKYLNYHLRT